MRYLIVGAGGIGGYFGARLAADGNDVTFQVRGRQAEAMAAKGLRVLSPLGDVTVEEPQLLAAMTAPGHFDAVLLCTKLWDVEDAAKTLKPLLAHDSFVAPLQNGVDAEEIVAAALGRRHVVGAVAEIAAQIEEPGVIRHRGALARVSFGELDGSPSWRLNALEAALSAAGVDVRLSDKISKSIWQKFILLTGLGRCDLFPAPDGGRGLGGSGGPRLSCRVGARGGCGGQSQGSAPVSADIAEKVIAAIDRFPPDAKSSMLVDLEQGSRLELNWLNGAVVRLGRELGVPTPRHGEVVEALKPHAEGPPSTA